MLIFQINTSGASEAECLAERKRTKMRLLLLVVSFYLAALAFGNIVHAADTNTTVSSTVVDKAPPTASAPSIVINNNDVCKSAASASIQTQILGFASGITVTDENCERLKLARSMYGMGMKVAAVSMLCQDARAFDAMWMAGTPCPYKGAIGNDAKLAWEANPDDVPSDSKVFKKKVASLQMQEETQEYTE